MRWLAQKDLLGQDCFLLGAPAPLRRWLALAYCELGGREVEYMALSRDTTESDLKQVGLIRKWMPPPPPPVCLIDRHKTEPASPPQTAFSFVQSNPLPRPRHPKSIQKSNQRREIRGGSAIFVDQAPVRAAVEGRVLLLEGVEKAERNVLPLLNSLLENREMPLEDGRFLLGAKGACVRACCAHACESMGVGGILVYLTKPLPRTTPQSVRCLGPRGGGARGP